MSIAVTGLSGSSKGLQSFRSKGDKPNLLFIMTDQQRSDALSIAGNTVLDTPNLDRLAKQGDYFENAYTPVLSALLHAHPYSLDILSKIPE